MNTPAPRRPRRSLSTGSTPRPRKIAGRSPSSAPPTPASAPASPSKPTSTATPTSTGTSQTPTPGRLGSSRTTRALIGVLALVTVVLLAELALLVFDPFGGSDDATATAGDSSVLTVPAGRPVLAAELQVRDGVDAAAKAAQELVAVDYSKYDEEVARAVDLTTERYEQEYRQTIGDVKEQAVAQQLVVQANVVGQGVVRASRTRLEALIFLNQVVSRVRDGKPETVLTPYKVLVTMVHTDHGWLVDGLETDEPQKPAEKPDKTN